MNFPAGVQQASKFANTVSYISENDQVILMCEWKNVMSSQWSMFGREFFRQRNHFLNKLREAKLTVKLVRKDYHCL